MGEAGKREAGERVAGCDAETAGASGRAADERVSRAGERAAGGRDAAEAEAAGHVTRRMGGPGSARLDERGWWLSRADVVVLAGTLLVAGGTAAAWWLGARGAGGRAQDAVDASAGADADAGGGAVSNRDDAGLDAVIGYADGASQVVDPGGDGADGAGRAGSSASDAGGAASMAGDEGPYAVIQNTRGFFAALPLSRDATITVESDLGTNVVVVSEGAVRVATSDCANQVCVDSGWASWPGQVITCLPHQLVVQVVNDPADAAPLS